MRVKQKPTRPSRVRAPRRKAILYPSTAGRRQSPALQRPSRSRIGTPSSLRPHCDPDNPEKNDEAEERDEGHADGIGVGQDHTGASSIIPSRLLRISERLSSCGSMSWDANSISIEIARSSSRRMASHRKNGRSASGTVIESSANCDLNVAVMRVN